MTEEKDIINIIIHGRGGQGGVTASQIIAEAAFLSGNFKDVHAYPSFGAERRGAPIQSFAKLSRSEKIWDRAQIEKADIIIVLDDSVLNSQNTSEISTEGIFLINSNKEPGYFTREYDISSNVKIIVADVSKLASEKDLIVEGIPVVNIAILALLSKALNDLSLDNLKKIVLKRMGEKIGKRNMEVLEQVFELAKIS